MVKRISIGADHGGFALKEKIIKDLEKRGHKVQDEGTTSAGSCDYPQYGFDVAKKVSDRKADRGIVICKTGIGMSVIANKMPGVRAGLCRNIEEAISARQHNDTNVLVLAASKISSAKAIDVTRAWIKTKALGGRHAKRVRQIKELEKKVFKQR